MSRLGLLLRAVSGGWLVPTVALLRDLAIKLFARSLGLGHRLAYVVSREGKWRMVSVPEITGLTQARRLSDAARMARELIAVSLDTALNEIDVAVEVQSIGELTDLTDRLASIADDRLRAAELERRAPQGAAELAKALVDLDIPLRDVGAVLGVSHQRAHQLVSR